LATTLAQSRSAFSNNHGWCSVESLLTRLSRTGIGLKREELEIIVRTSDEGLFAFSRDGLAIRANQGHSVSVSLHLREKVPPPVLYQGTVAAGCPASRRRVCSR
jgi:putative RNA 2'-phosphotransferase